MNNNFLTEKELVILKALIRYGPQKVNSLAKILNTPRSSLYGHLEKMRKRGIVSCAIKNKTKTYRTCTQSDMQNKIETEIMDSLDKLVFLKKMVPSLYKNLSNADDLFFTVIEGEDDIIKAYMETLITENLTIKTFVNLNGFQGRVLQFIEKKLIKNRNDNEIRVNALISPDSIEAGLYLVGEKAQLITSKVVDIPFTFKFHISVYKDVVYIFIQNKERPLFIKTNYNEVFDFFSDLHDELWSRV